MQIKGNKFLITGGAGMIGSHTADRLVAAGASEVLILDNFVRGSMHNIKETVKAPGVQLVSGDVRDAGLLMELAGGKDGVFHMAGLPVAGCAENPREAAEVMLTGTCNVLEAAVKNNVGRLVYASSALVYGLADTFPTEETHHPYNNRTFYGAAKLAGESLTRSFAEMYGLRYAALRYYNVYGPRMNIHGKHTEVLVRWLDRIDAGQRPGVFGSGLQSTDLVYVDDAVEATFLAMESDVTDEVFNVASGAEITLLQLLDTLLGITGSELKPEFLHGQAVNPVHRRLGSTKKANDVLGFRAKVGLEDGLRRLITWREQLLAHNT